MAWSSVPFRSQNVMLVSTARPFDLMKDGRVRGVERVVAMDFSRTHHAHRRLHLLHGANLHWRRVRAQQQAVALRLRFLSGDEERVLRIARGMIRRKIQRFEVVVVGFNLRAFLDRVAQIAEDADDLVHRLDDGMLRADGAANAGESDVETLGREFARGSSALNAGERRLDRLLDFGLEFVDALPYVALVRLGAAFSHRSLSWVRTPFLRAIQRSRKYLPVVLGSDRR